jgi:hypothetical protein
MDQCVPRLVVSRRQGADRDQHLLEIAADHHILAVIQWSGTHSRKYPAPMASMIAKRMIWSTSLIASNARTKL